MNMRNAAEFQSIKKQLLLLVTLVSGFFHLLLAMLLRPWVGRDAEKETSGVSWKTYRISYHFFIGNSDNAGFLGVSSWWKLTATAVFQVSSKRWGFFTLPWNWTVRTWKYIGLFTPKGSSPKPHNTIFLRAYVRFTELYGFFSCFRQIWNLIAFYVKFPIQKLKISNSQFLIHPSENQSLPP